MDEKLLEILYCPHCRKKLNENNQLIECTGCGLKFEIKDGIPVLLIEKAILPDGIKSLNELKISD